MNQLRAAIERERCMSVVSLALDRFDGIVSSLGHHAGEQTVKLAAALLRERVSDGQILGHLSGQEFIIGLPGFDAQQASQWIDYQANLLRAGVTVDGANISLATTGGIACYPEHSRDPAELCWRASSARADALARHEKSAIYRLGQEDKLATADSNPRRLPARGGAQRAAARVPAEDRLPDARGLRRRGARALAAPGARLSDAGFVRRRGRAGWRDRASHALGAARVGRAAARRGAPRAFTSTVAANISVDDLVDEYLPYYLLDLVKRHGVPPNQVTLEVTESAMMHNVHKSLAVVSCIHELGFRISIDDFGTGQSALTQLKRLPVDELKIDRSFVSAINDRKEEAIVRATIGLAHELGLSVVAEGVETAETLDAARVARLRVRAGLLHRQAAAAARAACVVGPVARASRTPSCRSRVEASPFRSEPPACAVLSARERGISNVAFLITSGACGADQACRMAAFETRSRPPRWRR